VVEAWELPPPVIETVQALKDWKWWRPGNCHLQSLKQYKHSKTGGGEDLGMRLTISYLYVVDGICSRGESNM